MVVAAVPVVFEVDDTRRSKYGNKSVSKSCDGNAVLGVLDQCPLPAAAAAAAAAASLRKPFGSFSRPTAPPHRQRPTHLRRCYHHCTTRSSPAAAVTVVPWSGTRSDARSGRIVTCMECNSYSHCSWIYNHNHSNKKW